MGRPHHVINGEESAFAVNLGTGDCAGLSKREYLASAALQGLCAAITDYDGPSRLLDMDGIAKDAVELADALLAALSAEKEPT
jgi:hypothetical protein